MKIEISKKDFMVNGSSKKFKENVLKTLEKKLKINGQFMKGTNISIYDKIISLVSVDNMEAVIFTDKDEKIQVQTLDEKAEVTY